MLASYGAWKPSPGGNARLAVRSALKQADVSGYKWSVTEQIATDLRGPLMVGVGSARKRKEIIGVQLDLRSAYLSALQRPLAYGQPVLIPSTGRDIDRIPQSWTGWIHVDLAGAYPWCPHGPTWLSMTELRGLLQAGLVECRSKCTGFLWPTATRDWTPLLNAPRHIQKCLYQRGWPCYSLRFLKGRVTNHPTDCGPDERLDLHHACIAWKDEVPSGYTLNRPEVAADTCGDIRAKIALVRQACEKRNLDHGNVIVDSIIVPEEILSDVKLGDSPGSWRIAKRGVFSCGEHPADYRVTYNDRSGKVE